MCQACNAHKFRCNGVFCHFRYVGNSNAIRWYSSRVCLNLLAVIAPIVVVCEEQVMHLVSAPCGIQFHRNVGCSHVCSSAIGVFGACYVTVVGNTAVLSRFHVIAACQQVVVVPVTAVEREQ